MHCIAIAACLFLFSHHNHTHTRIICINHHSSDLTLCVPSFPSSFVLVQPKEKCEFNCNFVICSFRSKVETLECWLNRCERSRNTSCRVSWRSKLRAIIFHCTLCICSDDRSWRQRVEWRRGQEQRRIRPVRRSRTLYWGRERFGVLSSASSVALNKFWSFQRENG